jgi:hypothetical protein
MHFIQPHFTPLYQQIGIVLAMFANVASNVIFVNHDKLISPIMF